MLEIAPIQTFGNTQEFPATHLVEASTELLTNPQCDLIVVRGLITAKELLDDFSEREAFSPNDSAVKLVDDLYEAVPDFHVVDELISTFWERDGFVDYGFLLPHLVPTGRRTDSIELHTDFDEDATDILVGPISWNLCTHGGGNFVAQRTGHSLLGDNRQFSKERWVASKNTQGPLYVRSGTSYTAGDAIGILNLTEQTHHSVVNHLSKRSLGSRRRQARTESPRVAHLFDHQLEKAA